MMRASVPAVVLLVLVASGGEAREVPLRLSPAPGSPLRVGGQPTSITAADLNRDAKPDLAVSVGAARAVTVLLGNGRGGFAPAPGSPLPVAASPHLVAVGDLDRDRHPDLVATAHDSHGVFVWLGDGRGGFAAAPGSPFPALAAGRAHNHGLALGDLDGDGDVDVATTDDEAHVVAVLLGDGRGGFQAAPRSPFAVGREPYPLALGDVNGDGRLDAVTPNVAGASLSVLLGDGRGAFLPASGTVRVAARPYFVALGDLDADGRLDAVASHDDVALVTVLLGDGRGGFRAAAPAPLDVGRRVWKAVLHDMDRDGRPDLVLGAGRAVVVMLGNGRGGFVPAAGSPLPAGPGAWTLAVADFDGDGRGDVATADLEAGTISVLLQN